MRRLYIALPLMLAAFALPAFGLAALAGEMVPFSPLQGTRGVQFFAIAKTSERQAIAVGEAGAVAVITSIGPGEGGLEIEVSSIGHTPLTDVCSWSNGVTLVTGHDGALLRSVDKTSWQVPELVKVHKDTLDGPLFSCWCGSGGDGMAVGAFGRVLRTNDFGATWESIGLSDDDAYHLYRVYKSGEALVIAGEAGRLYRSTDDGSHWVREQTPYPGSLFGAMRVNDSDLLYGLRGTVVARKRGDLEWSYLQKPGVTESYFTGGITRWGAVLAGDGGSIDIVADGKISPFLRLQGRQAVIGVVDLDGHFLVATTSGVGALWP